MTLVKQIKHTYRSKKGVCLQCGCEYHETWLTPKKFTDKNTKARVFIHKDNSGVTEDWCLVGNEGKGESFL